MDIEEELKLAVATRNQKRSMATSHDNDTANVGAYLNQGLAEMLPNAIILDWPKLDLLVYKEYVPSDLWEELESYLVADWMSVPHKFIMEDYADEVYKPYLVGSKVTKADNDSVLKITFYLNQN